jgi:hypothetical protein
MEDDCWSILALENVNSLPASIALKTGQKKSPVKGPRITRSYRSVSDHRARRGFRGLGRDVGEEADDIIDAVLRRQQNTVQAFIGHT